MRHLLLPLIVCLQTTYIYPTIVTPPLRCFIWDTACLTALAQNIGIGYIQSIPELGSVKLDPLPIENLRVEKYGALFDLKDSKVYGLNNLIVDELSSYPNVTVSRLLCHTDLFLTGFYKASGSMFYIPINGEGEFRASFKNLEIELFIPYNIVKNANGEDVIEASDYNFRYNFKDSAVFQIDNLYYGNKERSELMHYLLNSNWKFITTEYGRAFVAKLVDSIAQVYKNYFRLAPLKSLVEY